MEVFFVMRTNDLEKCFELISFLVNFTECSWTLIYSSYYTLQEHKRILTNAAVSKVSDLASISGPSLFNLENLKCSLDHPSVKYYSAVLF